MTASADASRRSDLARIHIGRIALGWDEVFYRRKVAQVCNGKTSSAELDASERRALLAHMVTCGWAPAGKAGAVRTERKPLTKPQKLMWSLWQQLADAGLVANRKMLALNAFAQRQTGVDRIEWLNGKQEDLVIESLKRWLKRREAPGDGA